MMPKTVALCLSGGMDSVTLLHQLVREKCLVFALIFNYGQKAFHMEAACARHHADQLGVNYAILTLPMLRGSELTDGVGMIVPNRNAVLLSHAVNWAASSKPAIEAVCYACNHDDEKEFPDCRMAFVQAFNHLLMMARIDVEVCAPYQHETKKQIAARAFDLGVDLETTYSCYRGGVTPCGECGACKKRQEALA